MKDTMIRIYKFVLDKNTREIGEILYLDFDLVDVSKYQEKLEKVSYVDTDDGFEFISINPYKLEVFKAGMEEYQSLVTHNKHYEGPVKL